MESRWRVAYARPYDENRYFGPAGDALPKSFGAAIDYTQTGLTVELGGDFDGDHLAIRHMTIYGAAEITPRLLGGLAVASALREIGLHLLHRGDFDSIGNRVRPARFAPDDDELRAMATLYWREHVIGGNPTRAVEQAWNAPKSTVNRWLRAVHQRYPLPDR